MENDRKNNFFSPIINKRYISNKSNNNNLFSYESTKDNNDFNNGISLKDQKVLNYSLKELRREIKEMSDNIKKLNSETDKFIQNKNNNLKNFRSNSLNIPKQEIDIRNKNNDLSRNLIINKYCTNNSHNFLKNNQYQNYRNIMSNTEDIYYMPNGNNNIPIKNYYNYKNNKNNLSNISEPNKIYNQQNINYITNNDSYYSTQNNFMKNYNNNINNNRALSVDNDKISQHNQNKKVNNLFNQNNNYLLNENKENKNPIKIKSNDINYFITQIKQKDDLIQKLKEEISKIFQYKNQIGKSNNNNEPKQILKKNRELIEENEKLKLKLKNQIENERNIMKDKIKTNILNNSQSDEIIKINNQIEYWKDEYDKLYAENITLKKKLDNLTNENELHINEIEKLKNSKKDIKKIINEKNKIMKEKEDLEMKLNNKEKINHL